MQKFTNRYKFLVSYDGTDYKGWQEQKTEKTVAGTLKQSFCDVFKKDCSIVGASRTDAGVHADGQVARIRTDLEIDPEQMSNAWNNVLPSDIVIRDIQLITDNFHPFKNVVQKTYWYHLFEQRPLPFSQRFGWYFAPPIDHQKLKEALNVFVGTHDFRSFATDYDKSLNTVRRIDSIDLVFDEQLNAYRICVKGPSFLHHMIRRIVGAAVEVAFKDRLQPNYLREVLAQKNPRQTLQNAPGKGLTLYSIEYGK